MLDIRTTRVPLPNEVRNEVFDHRNTALPCICFVVNRVFAHWIRADPRVLVLDGYNVVHELETFQPRVGTYEGRPIDVGIATYLELPKGRCPADAFQ